MKTTYNLICVKSLLIIVLTILSFTGFSQPDYVFRNSSLISGSSRQIGAKYRFPRVKAGTDAIVTIIDIKRATLDELDGGGGFDEAFQPAITVPRKSDGFVEFKVDFVAQGTNNLRVMPEVPLTAIDIDGYIYPDEKIYEYDEFLKSTTYRIDYDFIGSSLDVKIQNTWIKTINKTAIDYAGVDTVQKDVMFSMIHAGVSSVTFRVGANNKSNTGMQRLRSVYFKKFNYGSAVLSLSSLKYFNGEKENHSIALSWEFTNNTEISEYILERSINGQDFTAITSRVVDKSSTTRVYTYNDLSAGNNKSSYRLTMIAANGNTAHSQIILFRDNATNAPGKLAIYPTILQSNAASVQVSSEVAAKTMIQVVDYSGKVVYNTQVRLAKGANTFSLNISGKVASGSYVVVVPVNGKLLSEKIIIR